MKLLNGITAVAIIVLVGGALHAQAQAPAQSEPKPTFEVASVKANKSGEGFIRFGLPSPGRFNAENVPVRELIRFAYGVQPFQIEGGPGWIGSDRFNIAATAEGIQAGPPRAGQIGRLNLMMQSLLEERFKLKVRHETKEMPIYALVLARADGKLGPKLQPSKDECAAALAGRRGGGPAPAPPAPGQAPMCGLFMGPATMAGGSMPILNLAQALATRVNRQVVDKTGLEGLYAFTIEFAPEQAGILATGLGPPGSVGPVPAGDPNGPSLFTALQEQLGLKLESTRGPVEMIVIESVEQPTSD